MGLKYKVEKLDEVPETSRGLYKQEGSVYILDVDGAVDKGRLDEFRENNITLRQQLDKLKDIDPVKYRELTEIERKVKEKELIEAGKVEEVVELRVKQLKETLEGQNSELTTKLGSATKTLETLLLDNVIRDKAIKSGVLPSAIDDVVLRAKTVYSIENNAPVPKGADGKIIYGKDGNTPMPVDEWIVSLRKSASHLFQGAVGSGAGGGGRPGAADTSKLSPAQKISLGMQSMSREPAAGNLPG